MYLASLQINGKDRLKIANRELKTLTNKKKTNYGGVGGF